MVLLHCADTLLLGADASDVDQAPFSVPDLDSHLLVERGLIAAAMGVHVHFCANQEIG
jgi:hypothetical protein